MILDRPLLAITPTVDGDVLTVLAQADAAFTAPRIQKLIGRYSIPGVRKALHRLVGQGVVGSDTAGRTVRYWLNREHLAADAIIALAKMTDELISRIDSAVAEWPLKPALVMLFGSAARGGMHESSDIDLFVVGPADMDDDRWADQIAELERSVAAWTGNDARVLEYSTSDLEHGSDPVVANIQRDGVYIAGDRSLLSSAIGKAN